MNDIQRSDLDIIAVVGVFFSVISTPYIGWLGLLAGPAVILLMAWAYYSMVFCSWFASLFKRN